MSLAGIGRFYKNMMKSNYQLGRNIMNMFTRKMEPGKAKRVGAPIDLLAGTALTYIFGLQTLSYIAAGALAIGSIVTLAAPAAIPAALLTVGVSVVFGALGGLMTAIGVGFLAAAKSKISIPGPKRAIAGVGHAVGFTAHNVARPIKWTARKLTSPFKKAHDGKKPPNDPPDDFRPKPGRHRL